MPTLPILAVGIDGAWRERMRRLLGSRCEFDWQGAYAPAEPRRQGSGTLPSILLLDGDDRRSERAPRRHTLPAPRRLYFYRHPSVEALHHCVAVGAHGCLQKRAAADTILRAVRGVESNLFVLAPGLLKEALLTREGDADEGLADGDGSGLTGRQMEVLHWAARGMSNKEIARQLDISPETVKTHLHNMYERTGVHGRTALVADYLHEDAGDDVAGAGLLSPEPAGGGAQVDGEGSSPHGRRDPS
jgi:DNA-binding NarL/FixJ family response regulator